MPLASKKIQRTKVHEQLVEALVQSIQEGEFKEGEQLPSERDLMDTYGVGRPAVREAMAKLALVGLVEVRPGVRAKVCRPSASRLLSEVDGTIRMLLSMPGGIAELQDIRILFEEGVARRAARQRSEQDVRHLQDILDEAEDVLDDPLAFAELDIRFHSRLAEICANSLIGTLNKAMHGWLSEQRHSTLVRQGQSRIAHSAHIRVFKAVSAKDSAAAEEAMRAHLMQVHSVWFEEKVTG